MQAPSRARRAGRSLPGATQTAVAGSLAGVAFAPTAAEAAASVEVIQRESRIYAKGAPFIERSQNRTVVKASETIDCAIEDRLC